MSTLISLEDLMLCRDAVGKLFVLTEYFEESINIMCNDEFDWYLAQHIECDWDLVLCYREKKLFMDMMICIHLEDSHVRIFKGIPYSINELLEASDAMFGSEASPTCCSCSKMFQSLKLCGRCK